MTRAAISAYEATRQVAAGPAISETQLGERVAELEQALEELTTWAEAVTREYKLPPDWAAIRLARATLNGASHDR